MTKRDIIDGLKDALRTMGAAGITGSEAMQAFAVAHQLVGRLEAIHMEEQRCEAIARGKAPMCKYSSCPFPCEPGHRVCIQHLRDKQDLEAMSERLSRPAVDLIDPGDITPEMETEAARDAAFERVMMSPDDDRDGLDDLCDILDEELKPYLLPSRIASSF